MHGFMFAGIMILHRFLFLDWVYLAVNLWSEFPFMVCQKKKKKEEEGFPLPLGGGFSCSLIGLWAVNQVGADPQCMH